MAESIPEGGALGAARNAPLAWILAAAAIGGAALFGAVEPGTRGAVLALAAAASAAILFRTPPERRPGLFWLAVLAYPAWLLLQLIPIPASLAAALNPAVAAQRIEAWPGPLRALDGAAVAAAAPGAARLTLDGWCTIDLLARVLAALAVFWAARAAFAGPEARRARRALLWAAAGFAGLEAFYGLWQWGTNAGTILWYRKTAYLGDATGSLVNRNHFALLLYLGLGCTLTLLLDRPSAPRRGLLADGGKEFSLRAALALLAALQVVGILASHSRGGLGCAAIVVAGALIAAPWRNRRIAFVALGGAALLLAPALLVAAPGAAARFRALPAEWSSPEGRGAVARATTAMLGEAPVFGVGGGAFESAFARRRPESIAVRYDYAHNDYLETLFETGLPGLLFALLGPALFLRDLVRARRAERPPRPAPWPLYAAFAALALHEFFDFGLQLPGLLLFTALLAGASAPPPSDRPSRRAGRLAAFAAAAAVAPAVVVSGPFWPGVAALLPAHPEALRAAAARAFDHWRADKDAASWRAAVDFQTRALAARPTFAPHSVDHAHYVAAGLAHGAAAGSEDALRAEAARSAARARLLDPWDPNSRQTLAEVSLALGDVDLAVKDYQVLARNNADQAATALRTLREAGLPTAALAALAPRTGPAFSALLEQALSENDLAVVAGLVPENVAADEARCRAGALVADAQRRLRAASGRPFLEACRALPAVRADAEWANNVAGWLAREEIRDGRTDEAALLIRGMAAGWNRDWRALELAETTRDWPEAARRAEALLSGAEAPREPRKRAELHWHAAAAFGRAGQPAEALDHLRAVRDDAPDYPGLDRAEEALRRGENPF